MKEQIKAILQKYLQLDMPNPEEAEMKVANEIEKLYQCEHILEKVKEANTPKAMQEYADLYHKDKMREELIKFAGWITNGYLKTIK